MDSVRALRLVCALGLALGLLLLLPPAAAQETAPAEVTPDTAPQEQADGETDAAASEEEASEEEPHDRLRGPGDPPPETPEHVTGTNPYPVDTVDPRDEPKKPYEPLEFPESVSDKLALLSEEELEFLRGRDARRYTGKLDDTVEAMEERSPEAVREWVQAMMHVHSRSRYLEGRDAPNIPLNTGSARYNEWRLRRPRSLDPARKPGPIELGRYGGWGGPPTFGGLPLALYPEDLVEGEVDVAILGAPLNMGSGWRDSGAQATTELRLLGWPIGDHDQYVQVEASKVLNIVDYGDVAVDNESTERSMRHVREVVREIAETGAIPFIVGGDHSLEYPNVAALADVYGKERVSVIHFDSHYDAWWGGRHLISHGYPVYRLINEGHVRAADYIQVGLRSSNPDKEAFKWMREEGMRFHTMAEVERRGWGPMLDRIVAEASEEGRKLHISFDIDVLDPAHTVGTGTPVPGGLTMREGITIVRRLCAESNVVGFDLVELHPMLDPTYQTTLASAHIIKACLTGIALNEEGLTDAHYLSPFSVEHALDDYYGDQQAILDATAEEERQAEEDEEEAASDEASGAERDTPDSDGEDGSGSDAPEAAQGR